MTFPIKVVTSSRKLWEGVCEIDGRRGALHQTLSLCRDGLRMSNSLATDAVFRGEGLEEFEVFKRSRFFVVGAPVVIPVTVCSVVNITISEQAQAMDSKQE